MPTPEQVEVAVGTLRMLAEPTRLRILWLLVDGEQSVGRLAELAGVAPSVVSQHLGKLRLARLVTTRRDGNRIFYAAADVHVRQLLEEALFHADHLVGGSPTTGRPAQQAPSPHRPALPSPLPPSAASRAADGSDRRLACDHTSGPMPSAPRTNKRLRS